MKFLPDFMSDSLREVHFGAGSTLKPTLKLLRSSEANELIDASLESVGITKAGKDQLTIFNADNSKQCKILISDITSIEIYDIDFSNESKFESISKKIIENKEKNPLTLLDKPTRVIPKEEIGHLEMEFYNSSEPIPISDIKKMKINTPS